MLSTAEVSLLADTLSEALGGARLQKIGGPLPERFVLEFFGESGKRRLLIALEADLPRFHLVTTAPKNPTRPFPFVELLRKELSGARLKRVVALPGERIARLEFVVHRDDAVLERLLLIEVFQKSRNLVLTDGELKILGLLRRGGSGRSGLKPHGTWSAPPGGAPAPLDATRPFAFLEGAPQGDDLFEALEEYAAPREDEAREDRLRRTLASELRRRLKKERRLLVNLQKDLEEATRSDEYRRYGELLKQNLQKIPKRATEVVLTDWSQGESEEVTVPLDPKEAPLDAMNRWFKTAKKLDRTLPKVAARVGNSEERITEIEALLARTDDAEALVDLEGVRADAEARKFVKPQRAPSGTTAPAKKKPTPPTRKPYRTFTSKDGLDILVGKTSADNDDLSLRIARGNEHWFHVSGWAGSHVVVRYTDDDLPHETLLDAALLAAHFSQAPKGSRAEVHRTRAKHVSKFRGAKPGQVHLASYKSIRVRPDPDRLERLVNDPDRR